VAGIDCVRPCPFAADDTDSWAADGTDSWAADDTDKI
jgi:hypothetical protein